LLLRFAKVNPGSGERDPIGFVAGSAVLSLLVFLLCASGLATTWTFAVPGAGLIAAARPVFRFRSLLAVLSAVSA
jgi:hypothetical protein